SLDKLLWAHQQAKERKIENTTATCTLMSLLGERIYFSKGSEKNLKITTSEDMDILEALLSEVKE
ncbi:MAG: 2-C-methyl-D-erythritol 4-phosphate cytidylyltransferase, partial [Lachnospiraceae bacterium]|nr:2-C-methyl-D-erythritol 4-phosphate cytidylyltransferase [Lachnospiraceae bacterium]